MSHLSIERLAALADDAPTADERAHLSLCERCAIDLKAQRALLAMAGGEREAMGIPLTRWDTLAQRLRAEGLIASGRRSSASFPLRAAAAMLLIAGGALLGRISAGASPLPGSVTGVGGSEDTPVTSAAWIPPDSLPTKFASVDDAARWKGFYADAYQSAVSFLAANDSVGRPVGTPAVIRARLSALDRVTRTMREALNDAPYDPVVNDFYLNSFGQREATLRQLNTVLPQGVRLSSF
jgi:hypothetical protein